MVNSRGPRRSSECTRPWIRSTTVNGALVDGHTRCHKSDCTCSCHFGRSTQGNPANQVTVQSDRIWTDSGTTVSGKCTHGEHNKCSYGAGAAKVCTCTCHTPQKANTKPYVQPGIIIDAKDYPNIDWGTSTFADYCCYPAREAKASYRTYTGVNVGHSDCPYFEPNPSSIAMPKGYCECPCHILYTPQLTSTTTSSSSTPTNYRQAVARLAPIWDEVISQVFCDITVPMTFTGPAVRDALWGGDITDLHINCSIAISGSDLFTALWGKHLKSFTNYEYKDSIYSFVLTLTTGNVIVHIGQIPLASEIWSFDRASYSKQEGIISGSNISKVASLFNKQTITDPTETLKYGIEIATKYGFTLEQSSIEWLANRIQALEPPPTVNETLVGFRAYVITPDGKLRGQHNVPWPSVNLEVDCPDFVEHIKAVDSDWRMAALEGKPNQHECGIYIHKDPALCLYEVRSIQAMALVWAEGVVGDFEKGYRAQKCTIKKLWVFRNTADGVDKTPRLADGVYDCPIIGPASQSDFLYDPEVMQWAGRVQ